MGYFLGRTGAVLLVVVSLLLPGAAPVLAQQGPQRIEVAQNRTLFDLLFGPRQTTPARPPRTVTAPSPPSAPAPPPAPTALAPLPDVVEKAEGATRLAVFGDSLAIDLAKALQRAFAEDPNLQVISRGVGSSGFVRDDFYDWNGALADEIAADSFDLAVIIIGINDKQAIGRVPPLTDEWKTLYLERLNDFLGQLREAGKPAIWVGLPPMRSAGYSASVSEISSLHRLASVSAGVEFVDIYERFLGDDGRYSNMGPNLNGEIVRMRKGDGIHFSAAGSDKVAFFVIQALRTFYRGGAVSLEVSDVLEGTDAQNMVRPPFQGLGQFRLLEVAGAVLPLSGEPVRAAELILRDPLVQTIEPIDPELLLAAPAGRADDFGVGVRPEEETPAEQETSALAEE